MMASASMETSPTSVPQKSASTDICSPEISQLAPVPAPETFPGPAAWPPLNFRYAFDSATSGKTPGFVLLKGTIDSVPFEVVIQTLIVLIGRDNGERSFAGTWNLNLHKDTISGMSIIRPSGQEDFGALSWHPFDLTRIGFAGLKRLSRTHLVIAFKPQTREWTATSLSQNGIIHNEEKLPDKRSATLRNNDLITACGGQLKLQFRLPPS